MDEEKSKPSDSDTLRGVVVLLLFVGIPALWASGLCPDSIKYSLVYGLEYSIPT